MLAIKMENYVNAFLVMELAYEIQGALLEVYSSNSSSNVPMLDVLMNSNFKIFVK